MRGRLEIEVERGEWYPEPKNERTWMPIPLDAIFFWYNERYSNAEPYLLEML